MDISREVNSLVRRYQTRNPFEMIQGMNVILVSCPLSGVRGFYQYFQRNNIIYIDENLPEHEKLFVCAHELGHMFLHKKSNAIFMDTRTHFNTSKFEAEADKFAIQLLLSDDLINSYKEHNIEQISRITGYNERLIKLRMM
ncbi:ImmA/IrrE family metallo-endopeptidase [Lactonifactor sp. BIOML-A3]|nr:ImmA/IrrE family metallo-endopeptidase [Lactonifactor sp. BIOML-A5]MSA09899.1 ImmA/IrrE family metallo-endopeptidase [Lactonifactor sp. BIOML-A4]MSA13066.1 ImmA/IrrE family metallo-endopeptidase [Lactonifactor sp. BIOML-A3]MSA18602.1 ImmA/IrrE family metallo-endopeptidase [Lactonifactor sp. BIOML-A2]MSA38305.1 ImmA/IrrE family metallo-endopeptidase [Lactonifactor sp. BIOML-A1]MSB14348.1 ImmA/IrrE family metallo-endopeptidase [Lactonifactor sp. BIOML-A6]MSB69606.1 ImmA/IrrE family metallo-e